MISLSERIASVEAQLESAAQREAQYRRRIDTQLLTLSFQPPNTQASRSEVGQALRDVVSLFATGTAWTIRSAALLAPVLLALAVLVDRLLGADGVCRLAAIGFYSANEGLSIIENCSRIGVPFPQSLMNMLEKLRSHYNDDNLAE